MRFGALCCGLARKSEVGKADNDGVPRRTLACWSGLRLLKRRLHSMCLRQVLLHDHRGTLADGDSGASFHFLLRDGSRLSFERRICRLAVACPATTVPALRVCFCDGCTCWIYGPGWMAVVWVRAFLWRVDRCSHAVWRRSELFFSGVRRSFGWVSILHMAPARTMRRAQT